MNTPFLLLYILLMGISYPIMRFMSLQFDPISNNALRTLAGGIFLLALCFWKYRPQLNAFWQDKSALFHTFIIALFLAANMFCFTLGLQKTSALSGSIFSVLSMPLAVGIAAIVFVDERQRVVNRHFLIGTLLLLSGSFFFIFYKSGEHHAQAMQWGYLYLLLAISIQSVQNLFVKRLATRHHVIVMSAFTATFTALIYLAIGGMLGSFAELHQYTTTLLVLLLLSGIYGMVVGMLLAFYLMQQQGIVTYNVLQLIVPIATAVMGYFTLGETITPMQFMGAVLVIIGGVIALRIGKQ